MMDELPPDVMPVRKRLRSKTPPTPPTSPRPPATLPTASPSSSSSSKRLMPIISIPPDELDEYIVRPRSTSRGRGPAPKRSTTSRRSGQRRQQQACSVKTKTKAKAKPKPKAKAAGPHHRHIVFSETGDDAYCKAFEFAQHFVAKMVQQLGRLLNSRL